MKSIFSIMNKEVFGFIRQLDPDPEKVRPVTFWFYSESEAKIYRLAAHLKKNGCRIDCCEYSEAYRNYLCIAEKKMSPEIDLLNELCIDMKHIAEKIGVDFDGWETMIEME
ncbi:MAG: ribonuclease E inhibitor RraB [Balneolaceae bacterium]